MSTFASLSLLLISAATPASASPVKEAETYEAQLRADNGKMRLRQNLERLVELWGRAKKEDRRAALEGEARAWKLLAHWSGRADDKAKAEEAAAQLQQKMESKRERRVQPAAPVKESAARAMLAKVEVEGDQLTLAISGAFAVKRDVIPGRNGKGGRVFFDLAPVIVAKEALGNVQIARPGISRVRVGQFDDQTARIVIDLERDAGDVERTLQLEADRIALTPQIAKPAAELAAAASTAEPEPEAEPDLRAIVEDMKRAIPGEAPSDEPATPPIAKIEQPSEELDTAELAALVERSTNKRSEDRKRDEDLEPSTDERDAQRTAKIEPPLDEATMRALKRSTREAVQPREDRNVSIRRIVIDAGHGGRDRGARGATGVYEKDINLAIAMKLGAELKQRLGVKVIFTRTTDQFLTLGRRSQLANNGDADLFISIHANAHRKKNIHGIETYYLNTTSDRYAARLARRENTEGGGDEEGGDDPEPGSGVLDSEDASLPPGALGRDLRLLLADLAMRSASAESKRLAGHVQSTMVGTLRRKHDDLRDLGVKHALFYVLLGARMPSILIETGFVTNPTEGKRLADPEYQSQLAAAIAQGISRWVAERDALVTRSEVRDQTLASRR